MIFQRVKYFLPSQFTDVYRIIKIINYYTNINHTIILIRHYVFLTFRQYQDDYKAHKMKLVSVVAVLIASVNISLFVSSFMEHKKYPPLTLFLLSLVFISLIVLLQYEHRQFKNTSISIKQSSFLHKNYLFLFCAGVVLTSAQKFGYLSTQQHPNIKNYALLGQSIHDSLLYFCLNLGLGILYLRFFYKQYQKANRLKIGWQLAINIEEEKCCICLAMIGQGQKIGKIQCMHRFHLSCLNKWLKQKNQCPLCQSQITLIN